MAISCKAEIWAKVFVWQLFWDGENTQERATIDDKVYDNVRVSSEIGMSKTTPTFDSENWWEF